MTEARIRREIRELERLIERCGRKGSEREWTESVLRRCLERRRRWLHLLAAPAEQAEDREPMTDKDHGPSE